MKSLHIIIIIDVHDIVFTASKTTCELRVRRTWFDKLSVRKFRQTNVLCTMYNVQCTSWSTHHCKQRCWYLL